MGGAKASRLNTTEAQISNFFAKPERFLSRSTLASGSVRELDLVRRGQRTISFDEFLDLLGPESDISTLQEALMSPTPSSNQLPSLNASVLMMIYRYHVRDLLNSSLTTTNRLDQPQIFNAGHVLYGNCIFVLSIVSDLLGSDQYLSFGNKAKMYALLGPDAVVAPIEWKDDRPPDRHWQNALVHNPIVSKNLNTLMELVIDCIPG